MNIGDYLIHQPSGNVWIIRNVVGGSGQLELVGGPCADPRCCGCAKCRRMLSFENWLPKLPDGWEIADLPATTKTEFDKILNPKP